MLHNKPREAPALDTQVRVVLDSSTVEPDSIFLLQST